MLARNRPCVRLAKRTALIANFSINVKDAQAACFDTFGGKHIAQHLPAREREIRVQRVVPPHDRNIGSGVGLRG